jgi:hypothetical protein
VSADSDAPASPAPACVPTAPLSERTALAVLGSMLVLIVALTLLLLESTWVDPASAAEPPAADGGSLAWR